VSFACAVGLVPSPPGQSTTDAVPGVDSVVVDDVKRARVRGRYARVECGNQSSQFSCRVLGRICLNFETFRAQTDA
jgi:hypothetical protein